MKDWLLIFFEKFHLQIPTPNTKKQTITYLGSLCLNINNIMGPAIVAFPSIYAQSGMVSTHGTAFGRVRSVCVFVHDALRAMQRIREITILWKRYEFATTVKHYWGDKWYVASQLLMNICLQCLNIASIIVAAQVMDELFAYCYGETIGFQYTTMEIRTTQYSDLRDMPNAISAGFIFCMIICLPFGMSSLEENMWFQWFSLFALFGSCGLFIWDYLQLPLHFEQVPVWNSDSTIKHKFWVL